MSIFGNWKTEAIANTAAISNVIDLGNDWEKVEVVLGAMTAADISLLITPAMQEGVTPTNSTFYNLSSTSAFNCLTGNVAYTLDSGGFRYIKVNSSVAQGADRVIQVRGFRN